MSKNIVIIGAGAIGLSCALHCARRGHQVTVIERHAAKRDGCSFGNAGMIVPSHFVPLAAPGAVKLGLKWMFDSQSPFYIKPRLSGELFSWGFKFWRASNAKHVQRSAPLLRDLNFASRALYEEFAAETQNEIGLLTKGLLMLCRSREALEEETKIATLANELGVPAEVMDARQVAKLNPGLTLRVAGGVYFPKDACFQPEAYMMQLQRLCEKAGVKFQWSTNVEALDVQGDRIAAVETPRGEFKADEIVLASGVWSPMVAGELGLKIPMQAGKGYTLTIVEPPEMPEVCAILTEARLAVTPMGRFLRVGGTMELAGLNDKINPTRVQGIIRSFKKYFPEFHSKNFEEAETWRGLRPCSPDGLPYLGRTQKYSNLIVAAGHAMMGMSLSPITGKIVGDIVSGEKPPFDLSLLSPDRYA